MTSAVKILSRGTILSSFVVSFFLGTTYTATNVGVSAFASADASVHNVSSSATTTHRHRMADGGSESNLDGDNDDTSHRIELFPLDDKVGVGSTHPFLRMHYLSTAKSTQDEAKRLLQLVDDDHPSSSSSSSSPWERNQKRPPTCMAVTAVEQTAGRGTSSRQWIGAKGNVAVTVCVPTDALGVTPTLLPLKVGSTVARRLRELCDVADTNVDVTVKWPNDVLLDDRKVAGTLIEVASHQEKEPENEGNDDDDGPHRTATKTRTVWHYCIGIGINVAYAPSVPSSGPERGRPATSIRERCPGSVSSDAVVEVSKSLATQLALDLAKWAMTSGQDDRARSVRDREVVEEWKGWTRFGQSYTLRNDDDNKDTASGRADDHVVTMGIENDGQLRVIDESGAERLLSVDYLL